MGGENDRVAMVSDVNALEARLVTAVDALDERLTEMSQQFATRAEVKQMIADEGANTRRYFDIMVERMADLMKPLADGVAHHSTVLDDHESRIRQLEE